VPVLHYQREELRWGAAVAADLAALGATVRVIGVIGVMTGKEVRRC